MQFCIEDFNCVFWVTFLPYFLCFNSDDLDSESLYGQLEEPLEISPIEEDPEAGTQWQTWRLSNNSRIMLLHSVTI